MTPSERRDQPEVPPAPPLTHRPVPLGRPSRTSPLTVALELLGIGGLLTGLALAMLAGAGPEDLIELWVGFVVIGARLVGWWYRTYTVTAGELILDEGVLQKHHRVVPVTRIQQVELRQQLMARALGITTVHIETAAESGGTAVSLRSLDLHTAEALRDHLLAEQRRLRTGGVRPDADAAATGSGQPLPARTPLVRLTPWQLGLGGATSTAVVVAASLGLPAAAAGAPLAASALDGGVLLAAALFGAFAVMGALLVSGTGALGALVSEWGFELSASGDDLHVTQGLLDRRQHTMPRSRLQHARVVDNPLRRALGTASVQLHSGATPGRGDEQQGYIDIPVVRRAQVGDLLVAAMGSDDFRPPPLEPRPPAARRRAIVRRTALTAALAAAIATAWWPAGAASLPLALLGVPWGTAAHRRAGSALGGDVLAVASGVVVHRLELVPAPRVQSARTSASPLQRRVDLATLHLDVAGGSPVGAPGLGDMAAEAAESAMRRVTRRL